MMAHLFFQYEVVFILAKFLIRVKKIVLCVKIRLFPNEELQFLIRVEIKPFRMNLPDLEEY